MSVPTIDETYIQLREHVTKAQEHSAMLAHLINADGGARGRILAKGWLTISEAFKLMNHQVIELMKGRLN